MKGQDPSRPGCPFTPLPPANAYPLTFSAPMKKHSRTLLALLLGLMLTAGLLAAKAPAEGKSYEYVMIEKTGYRIYVTEGANKFEERKLKEEIKDFHNQGELFKLVHEFEARGYEVYGTNQVSYTNSNGTTIGSTFLLRKPR
jgi:hypothetical protein